MCEPGPGILESDAVAAGSYSMGRHRAGVANAQMKAGSLAPGRGLNEAFIFALRYAVANGVLNDRL